MRIDEEERTDSDEISDGCVAVEPNGDGDEYVGFGFRPPATVPVEAVESHEELGPRVEELERRVNALARLVKVMVGELRKRGGSDA